ncbi:peptidoglycan bridge formation glycyltransferase FemA/FemB family protein [Patescibacteria group bacterium]|nr:peptidoglycan bridge formation glycyltransferase FemA/FemB family protein [Patescibacteria group bacterium]MCL5091909.1 peptidoglycan bridge formation glycyltransferase FemA/FemB family protein [Patescibacteria group bacterium]
MRIKPIGDRSVWTDFFQENQSPSFLQSWEWGEFQTVQGTEILRLGMYRSGRLEGAALILKIRSKRGRFLFIPHGPWLKNRRSFPVLVNYLTEMAKRESFDFVRIAPAILDNRENAVMFSKLGFKPAPIYMHAETMWVLPLESEVEMLDAMRKSTRYNINRAVRDGVTVEKRTDIRAVEAFWKIYQQTARREQFVPFSQRFISNEFNAFNQTGRAAFFFAYTPTRQCIAAALIIFTPSTAFYHQGATTHAKVPGSHLLQWEAIKEAKRRDCRYYNFWGIHRPGRTPRHWTGLTLFKQGFGGERIDYLPTQDLIVSPKYYLTYWYEKYLGWRRGV